MNRAALLAVGIACLAATAAHANPGIETSVVRIVTNVQRPDWYAPWSAGNVQWSTGSGFVIGGGRIMTNAHVVSDARFVVLFLYGDPNPHQAKVLVEGHDCDLALLEPLEAHLLDKIPALGFNGLPRLRSVVETYGYPSGGDQISSTRGVVSRIERQVYVHSAVDAHLAVQTDAAINPGNSGGPVLQDGKVVGVAFQNNARLSSVGFFIPTEVVNHFLTDAADGRYDGYPDLAIRTVTLDNPAARKRAGMHEGETGVLVDWIAPVGGAAGKLRIGDVLLSVEGQPVANDGTVTFGELRQPYGMLLDRHQVGEPVTVTILREGTRQDVTVPMIASPVAARLGIQYDVRPRYFVYGGLVFVPLTRGMMQTFQDNWMYNADAELLQEFLFRAYEDPESMRYERVVLLRRLDDPVNADLSWYGNIVVDKVNGRTITSLADVVSAFEQNKDRFHTIEFAYFGRLAVLDRERTDRANAAILANYGVTKDRNL